MTIEEALIKARSATLRILAARFGLQVAEDAVQHASLKAVEKWKEVPDCPKSWLVKVGRNYVIDQRRMRNKNKSKRILGGIKSAQKFKIPEHLIEHDGLRHVFSCCDPSLNSDEKRALALWIVGSFSTDAIARAFIHKKTTVIRRITRAKDKVSDAHTEYPVLSKDDIDERLVFVREIVFIISREAFVTTKSEKSVCRELTGVSIALARALVDLRNDSENRGLLALMLLFAAWVDARIDGDGKLVSLAEMDRSLWNREMLKEVENCLDPIDDYENIELDNYQVQAYISHLFSQGDSFVGSDWIKVELLYERLEVVYKSLGTSMMHVVSLFFRYGKSAAWEQIEKIEAEAWEYMVENPYYYALKAHLHEWSCEYEDSVREYKSALRFTNNLGERLFAEDKINKLSKQITTREVIDG